MDSRNNSPRNEKQQELVKRLEEIRRQRNTIETAERQLDEIQKEPRHQNRSEPVKRNTSTQRSSERTQRPQRTSQRRNTQRNQPTRRKTGQFSPSTPRTDSEVGEYVEDTVISQEQISDEILSTDLTAEIKKPKKNYSKPLLNQLSSGENLAQAIILNEILSKPIALRYNNR